MEGGTRSPDAASQFAVLPEKWDEDPLPQLRALRVEIIHQRDFPTSASSDFMAAAYTVLVGLPAHVAPGERAEALIAMSRFYYLNGQNDRAIPISEAALEAALASSQRNLEARARMSLATTLRNECDYFRSLQEFARTLELARADGDGTLEAKALNNLGNWYAAVGLSAEALETFERVAVYFESVGDRISAWMALDNAADVALWSGDIQRGITLSERAAEVWSDEATTTSEQLWVVQGMSTYCKLLIQANRVAEAVACARTACTVAASSGSEKAKSVAALAHTVAAVAQGTKTTDALIAFVEHGRKAWPTAYGEELEVTIQALQRSGQFDTALTYQRELLALERERKFEAVRRGLGRASPLEAEGVERLAELETAVDRVLSHLTGAAVTQALRAGHDHARVFRVSRLAQLFAQSEKWSAEHVSAVALGGKLLDVGAMVLPDQLLSKTRSLSAGECKIVDEHAAFGAELLARTHLAMLVPCIPIVRFHHERWDGTGPNSLEGQGIPAAARLATICDVFDALTHSRPWRPAMKLQSALISIESEAGSRFDPDLCKRFVRWATDTFREVSELDNCVADETRENSFVRAQRRILQMAQTGVM